MFTEEQIAQAFRRSSREIDGLGQVWMREMSEEDFIRWQKMDVTEGPDRNQRYMESRRFIIAATLCDENGIRWYSDPAKCPVFPLRTMNELADLAFEVNDLKTTLTPEERVGNSEAETTGE
jgi:hypothetical protein